MFYLLKEISWREHCLTHWKFSLYATCSYTYIPVHSTMVINQWYVYGLKTLLQYVHVHDGVRVTFRV